MINALPVKMNEERRFELQQEFIDFCSERNIHPDDFCTEVLDLEV